MKDQTGGKRAFYWNTRAFYAKSFAGDNPSIGLGMFHEGGGTSGEMTVEWVDIYGSSRPRAPRLMVFSDGWSALATFGDLLAEMGKRDSEDPTEEQFVKMLLACGFEDITAYKPPHQTEAGAGPGAPTEPGWYWYGEGGAWQVVEVETGGNTLCPSRLYAKIRGHMLRAVSNLPGQWSERITEPGGPTS